MKFMAAARRPRNATGKIQPTLVFLMGIGFLALGLRTYPAFIGVGSLFLYIAYRGFTCRINKVTDRE